MCRGSTEAELPRQLYLHRQSVSKLPANSNRLCIKPYNLLKHAMAKASGCLSGVSLSCAFQGSAPSAQPCPAFCRVQSKTQGKEKLAPPAASWPWVLLLLCPRAHTSLLLHPPACFCLFHDAMSTLEQVCFTRLRVALSVMQPWFLAECSEHPHIYIYISVLCLGKTEHMAIFPPVRVQGGWAMA